MRRLLASLAALCLAPGAFAQPQIGKDENIGITSDDADVGTCTGLATQKLMNECLSGLAGGAGDNLGVAADRGDIVIDGSGNADLDELDVEAELETVLDLQDISGSVTDVQVPNTITIDKARSLDAQQTGTTDDVLYDPTADAWYFDVDGDGTLNTFAYVSPTPGTADFAFASDLFEIRVVDFDGDGIIDSDDVDAAIGTCTKGYPDGAGCHIVLPKGIIETTSVDGIVVGDIAGSGLDQVQGVWIEGQGGGAREVLPTGDMACGTTLRYGAGLANMAGTILDIQGGFMVRLSNFCIDMTNDAENASARRGVAIQGDNGDTSTNQINQFFMEHVKITGAPDSIVGYSIPESVGIHIGCEDAGCNYSSASPTQRTGTITTGDATGQNAITTVEWCDGNDTPTCATANQIEDFPPDRIYNITDGSYAYVDINSAARTVDADLQIVENCDATKDCVEGDAAPINWSQTYGFKAGLTVELSGFSAGINGVYTVDAANTTQLILTATGLTAELGSGDESVHAESILTSPLYGGQDNQWDVNDQFVVYTANDRIDKLIFINTHQRNVGTCVVAVSDQLVQGNFINNECNYKHEGFRLEKGNVRTAYSAWLTNSAATASAIGVKLFQGHGGYHSTNDYAEWIIGDAVVNCDIVGENCGTASQGNDKVISFINPWWRFACTGTCTQTILDLTLRGHVLFTGARIYGTDGNPNRDLDIDLTDDTAWSDPPVVEIFGNFMDDGADADGIAWTLPAEFHGRIDEMTGSFSGGSGTYDTQQRADTFEMQAPTSFDIVTPTLTHRGSLPLFAWEATLGSDDGDEDVGILVVDNASNDASVNHRVEDGGAVLRNYLAASTLAGADLVTLGDGGSLDLLLNGHSNADDLRYDGADWGLDADGDGSIADAGEAVFRKNVTHYRWRHTMTHADTSHNGTACLTVPEPDPTTGTYAPTNTTCGGATPIADAAYSVHGQPYFEPLRCKLLNVASLAGNDATDAWTVSLRFKDHDALNQADSSESLTIPWDNSTPAASHDAFQGTTVEQFPYSDADPDDHGYVLVRITETDTSTVLSGDVTIECTTISYERM